MPAGALSFYMDWGVANDDDRRFSRIARNNVLIVLALGLIIPFIVGRSVGTAMLVMVVFGLGLASPFLVVGIFAGALTALPRAGAWMLGIKKVFALLLVRKRAKVNSFHAPIKPIIVAATIPGAPKGMMMLAITLKREQPSTIALSSISLGMLANAPMRIHVAIGALKAA